MLPLGLDDNSGSGEEIAKNIPSERITKTINKNIPVFNAIQHKSDLDDQAQRMSPNR